MKKNVKQPIFLCGMMGAGKSAVGKELAARLNVPFVDLDDLIESAEGLTIPEIFSQKGEEKFRSIERELLLKHSGNADGVMALGGGSLQNQILVDHIKHCGWLVFLNPPRSVLLERLQASEHRPMLNSMNHQSLKERIDQLLLERLPFYQQAHFSIITGNGPIIEAADMILKKINTNEA